jgi:trigger factor
MEIRIKEPKEWLKELEFEIEPERVKSRWEEVTQVYLRKSQISGFRKGKAPKALVEKRFSESIESDTIDRVIQECYKEAVDNNGYKPITRGEATDIALGEDRSLKFKVSFEVIPQFELGGYTGIRVKRQPIKGFDQALNQRLAEIQERLAVFSPVARPAQTNDFLLVDWTVYDGQKVFKKDAGVLLKLGDDLNFKEINQGLVGASAGDERLIEIEFPKDFSDPELAQKKLSYRFKIRDVKERQLPPVDDDLARNLKLENLKALQDQLTAELKVEEERLIEKDLVNQIYKHLIEIHTFSPPPSLVANVYFSLIEENRLSDSEETRKKILPIAGERVKLDLILDKIIEREGLKATPEEVQKRIEEYARDLKTDPDKLKDSFYRLRRMEGLATRISREKTSSWLLNQARVESAGLRGG